MAVQIPTIQRNQVQPEASVGRTNLQPIDTVKPMMAQANASERLAGSVENYFEKEKVRVSENTALGAANEYHRHVENGLVGKDGLADYQGPPAEKYKQYEESKKAAKDSILAKYENADDYTKAAIQRGLVETDSKFRDRETTLYAKKQNDWEDSNYKGKLENDQNDARHTVAHWNIKDPRRADGINSLIAESTKVIEDKGRGEGRIRSKDEKDAQGNTVTTYIYDQSIKNEINEQRNKIIVNAVKTLNLSKDIGGAKDLLESHGQYVAVNDLKTLENDHQTAAKKAEGGQIFAKMLKSGGMDYLDRELKAGRIDPEVADVASGLYDGHERRMEHQKDQRDEKVHDGMMKMIMQAQKDGTPYQSVEELENDPEYEQVKGMMSAKRIQSLHDAVLTPHTTDPETDKRLYDIAQSPDGFKGYTRERFNFEARGANKKTRDMFERKFLADTTQSIGEKTRSDKYIIDQIEKQLIASKYLKKGVSEPYSKTMERKKLEALNKFDEEYAKHPLTNPTTADMDRYATKFAADLTNDKAFIPPEFEPVKPFTSRYSKAAASGSNYPAVQVEDKVKDPGAYKQARQAVMTMWKRANPGKGMDSISTDQWNQMTENYMKKNGN